MCNKPNTKDGKTFACRTCDECIATRRASWVARAMMERATSPHAICVTLTYNDETQANRDAAQFFAYGDVRSLLQRITSALRRIDQSHWVRFICAGEQGSRFNRCHWHLVLFSSYDLRLLGEVTLNGKPVKDPEAMLTIGKRKRRLHWSLWAEHAQPKGFVTFGAAGVEAMHYTLSYCLKDQFTVEKSHGTMRANKIEAFATGLFRMSKRPPIGEAWLNLKIDRLAASGSVLPSLDLKVPGMSGYFHPSGLWREKMLHHMRRLNDLARETTGTDAPQWDGLLNSLINDATAQEILTDGEQENPEDFEDAASVIARKAAFRSGEASAHRKSLLSAYRLRCQDCLFLPGSAAELLPAGNWQNVRDQDSPFWQWASDDGKTRTLGRLSLETLGVGDLFFCEACGTSHDVLAVPVFSETPTHVLQVAADFQCG